jgi:hypothetical protein
MDAFKVIIGSSDPTVEEILQALSPEESKLVLISKDKAGVFQEVDNVQNAVVIIHDKHNWGYQLHEIPGQITNINPRSTVILLSEQYGRHPAFHSTIPQKNKLLEVCKFIINKNTKSSLRS